MQIKWTQTLQLDSRCGISNNKSSKLLEENKLQKLTHQTTLTVPKDGLAGNQCLDNAIPVSYEKV